MLSNVIRTKDLCSISIPTGSPRATRAQTPPVSEWGNPSYVRSRVPGSTLLDFIHIPSRLVLLVELELRRVPLALATAPASTKSRQSFYDLDFLACLRLPLLELLAAFICFPWIQCRLVREKGARYCMIVWF